MNPPGDDELSERAAIDGRAAFAMVAFAVAALLIVLLDRVGVPERIVAAIGPAAALGGMALIGVLARSMRVSSFYAAGRATPPAYAGLALAGLAVALALPFTPPVADHFSGGGLFAGFGGGLACAVLISGPYLRKSGAFSVSDLIASRFRNNALRLGIAIVSASAALLAALAGLKVASAGLATIVGLSRPAAVALLGIVIVFAVAPGGLRGAIWTAVTAAGLFFAIYLTSLAVHVGRGGTLAAPFGGDAAAWATAMDRIAEWQGEAGQPASLTLSLGMALGMAACAPLLAPVAAVRDRIAAARAGVGALFWGAAFACVVAATVATAALGLLDSMAGRRPDRLPDAIYAASSTGLVAICGASVSTPAQAADVCRSSPGFAGAIGAGDIQTRGLFLLTALAPLSGLGAAASGLVWAAVTALALALAACGLFAGAAALGNDAFHKTRDRAALASRRLAITRLLAVAAAAGGAATVGTVELDPRVLIGLSLAISAAGVAPLLALALWPRARGLDAIVTLIVGLGVAEAVILTGAASVERIALAAVAGCACGFAAGIAASFVGRGDRSAGEAFVKAILSDRGDALAPDKGA